MDRRQFLMAGAGLAVAAACGNGGRDADVKVDTPKVTGPAQVNLVVASFVHVAGIDQRVTVALLKGDTSPLTPDQPVQLTIDGQPVAGELHTEGISLPYLLFRHRFQKAGIAQLRASYKGETAEAALEVVAPDSTQVPYPGRPLVNVPTPTVSDHRGVEPICTRQPACALHDVSLDAALAEKRPIALLFSTPALCESRLCGPVLDNLLVHHQAFAGRVRFIHAEIYSAPDGRTLAPAVRAFALKSEPVLFLAGPDGVVRDRLDNAFDRAEARKALEELVKA